MYREASEKLKFDRKYYQKMINLAKLEDDKPRTLGQLSWIENAEKALQRDGTLTNALFYTVLNICNPSTYPFIPLNAHDRAGKIYDAIARLKKELIKFNSGYVYEATDSDDDALDPELKEAIEDQGNAMDAVAPSANLTPNYPPMPAQWDSRNVLAYANKYVEQCGLPGMMKNLPKKFRNAIYTHRKSPTQIRYIYDLLAIDPNNRRKKKKTEKKAKAKKTAKAAGTPVVAAEVVLPVEPIVEPIAEAAVELIAKPTAEPIVEPIAEAVAELPAAPKPWYKNLFNRFK